MANHVTGFFPKPIELEFEKIMCPFLQVAKKRYLYVEWNEILLLFHLQYLLFGVMYL